MREEQTTEVIQDAARFRFWAENPLEIWTTPSSTSVEKAKVRIEDGPNVLGEFTPTGDKLADLRTALDLAMEKLP